jgi:integrase
MKRQPFDLQTLKKLAPRARRFELRDPVTPGLFLRVMPSGAKVFDWRRRVNGRVVRVVIGPLADFKLIEDVRAEAMKHNMAKVQHVDPAAERRTARKRITFGELWTLYLERWAKPNKRSWHTDEKRYRRHLKDAWEGRKLGSIHRSDVVELLEKIAATAGPIQANRVRALGHKMLRWAQSIGLDVENPFAGTHRNPENRKDRHLQPDELRRFWRALLAEPDSETRDFAMLLLLTAVRGGTLAAAKWEDIDLKDRTWRIPPDAMKAGKPLTLPLAPRAVEVFAERRAFVAESAPWVFPSSRGTTGHLQGIPREGWLRVLAAAKVAGLTPHDLRRTHATYGLNAGVPIEVLGKALGHTPIGGVTSIYAQAGDHLVRLAVERTVAAILRVAEAEETEAGNVLDFPRPAWAGEA